MIHVAIIMTSMVKNNAFQTALLHYLMGPRIVCKIVLYLTCIRPFLYAYHYVRIQNSLKMEVAYLHVQVKCMIMFLRSASLIILCVKTMKKFRNNQFA